VSPVRTLDELVPSSRQKRRAPYIVAGVLGTVVIVALAAAYLPLLLAPGPGRVFGPYTLGVGGLNLNESLDLVFPACSVVTVNWSVVGSGNATFTVWGPPNSGGFSCAQAPPYENLTCPTQGCPAALSDDLLVCVEGGTGGMCKFQAGPSNITFLNYVPFDSSLFTEVSFNGSYT